MKIDIHITDVPEDRLELILKALQGHSAAFDASKVNLDTPHFDKKVERVSDKVPQTQYQITEEIKDGKRAIVDPSGEVVDPATGEAIELLEKGQKQAEITPVVRRRRPAIVVEEEETTVEEEAEAVVETVEEPVDEASIDSMFDNCEFENSTKLEDIMSDFSEEVAEEEAVEETEEETEEETVEEIDTTEYDLTEFDD